MMRRLSRCSMSSTRWSMVDDAWSSPATSWTLGLSRYSLTSVATPLSSVAENSRRWPPSFVSVEDALHGLEESEVAHVVGLVEHRDGDLAEVELALLDEVLDAARRSDDDVDAALQRADLAVLRNSAVDLRGEQADAAGDGLHRAVDLQGELAGRSEDEGARLASHLAVLAAVVLHQALDERGTEGDGLAGAGLAASEHVAAGEHIRDGRGLDRERRLGAEGGELANDVAAETEVGEGHALDILGLDGVGLEALEHDVILRSEGLLLAVRVEVAVATVGAFRTVVVRRTLGAGRTIVVVRRTLSASRTVVVRRTLGPSRTSRCTTDARCEPDGRYTTDAQSGPDGRCTTDAPCEPDGRCTTDAPCEPGGHRTRALSRGRTIVVRRTLGASRAVARCTRDARCDRRRPDAPDARCGHRTRDARCGPGGHHTRDARCGRRGHHRRALRSVTVGGTLGALGVRFARSTVGGALAARLVGRLLARRPVGAAVGRRRASTIGVAAAERLALAGAALPDARAARSVVVQRFLGRRPPRGGTRGGPPPCCRPCDRRRTCWPRAWARTC